MKKILGLLVVIGILVMPAHASDNLTIPNTFSSGETISSSKMNENFTAIVKNLNNLSLNIDAMVLFSSDIEYDGNLGGRTGADNICRNQEVGTKLANFMSSCSNIRAFLSVNNTDQLKDMPSNYSIPQNKLIISIAGNILAQEWNDLIGQEFESALFYQNIGSFYNWTGSNTNGEVYSTCENWNSNQNNVQGTLSRNDMTQNNWLEGGGYTWCQQKRKLLCICY